MLKVTLHGKLDETGEKINIYWEAMFKVPREQEEAKIAEAKSFLLKKAAELGITPDYSMAT